MARGANGAQVIRFQLLRTRYKPAVDVELAHVKSAALRFNLLRTLFFIAVRAIFTTIFAARTTL